MSLHPIPFIRYSVRPLTAAAAAVLLALLSPAGDPSLRAAPPEAAVTYVGPLGKAPESARLALVSDGKGFVAYACSADDAFNATYATWVRGKVGPDGSFAGTGQRGVRL